jgi:hypothetical protein
MESLNPKAPHFIPSPKVEVSDKRRKIEAQKMPGQLSESDIMAFLNTIAARTAPNQATHKHSVVAARWPWAKNIASFCMAIVRNDTDLVKQIKNEIESASTADGNERFKEWFAKCSLLFGAERELLIVKHFVEVEKVARDDILREHYWRCDLIQDPPCWNDSYARNALLFAMDSGNLEVSDYLLQEWNDRPVSGNVAL